MEPPYYYVRERSASAAHHWDYINGRNDQALCGHDYQDPITLGAVDRPKAVCRACQARIPHYEAIWWRKQAESSLAELTALRLRHAELELHSDNQRKALAAFHKKLRDSKRPPTSDQADAPSTRHPVSDRLKSLGLNEGRGSQRKKAKQSTFVSQMDADALADDYAQSQQRSQKPSTWRVGRSPSYRG